jgi:hypothetical protein
MRCGVPPETFSIAVDVLCGALLLLLLARFSARAAGASAWIWVAPLALAANRTFCAWSTGGLGTQFFALLVFLALARFVAESRTACPRPFVSGLLFGLATFARPEGGLFGAVAGSFLLAGVARRRRPFAAALWFGVPFAAIVAAHFAWRHAYYGEWLPNTFYAKVSGFWWEQAKVYLGLFATDHWLAVSLPLLAFLPFGPRDAALPRRLFLAALATYGLYLAYVGGDRFEYRFMTPALPLLYWLLQEGARGAHALLQRRDATRRFALEAAVVLCAVVVGTSAVPLWTGFPEQRNATTGIQCVERIGDYAEGRAIEGRFLRRLVREGYLSGDELIAVRGAGALPYYSGFPILDLHGLNDKVIARSAVEERGIIAHEKMATPEYVRERAPVICNVLNTIVFEDRAQAAPLFDPRFRHYAWFPQPVRCVRALGKVLVFGTTLTDEEFRAKFAKFDILQ